MCLWYWYIYIYIFMSCHFSLQITCFDWNWFQSFRKFTNFLSENACPPGILPMCRGWAIDRFNIGDLSVNFFMLCGLCLAMWCFFSQISSYDMFSDGWVSDLWLIVYVTTIKILTQLWFKHGNLRTVWFNIVLHKLKLRVPPLSVFGPLPRWVRACISSSWSVDIW